MQDFQNLIVWRKAHALSFSIYQATKRVGYNDRYLVNQIRRSSFSVSCNIAEGCGRRTEKDKAHFFQMAFSSACEVEYQLIFLKQAALVNLEEFTAWRSTTIEVKKMLSKLLKLARK